MPAVIGSCRATCSCAAAGDIMAIDTDGAGTLLAGDKERYVIEIIDPGRSVTPAVACHTHASVLCWPVSTACCLHIAML